MGSLICIQNRTSIEVVIYYFPPSKKSDTDANISNRLISPTLLYDAAFKPTSVEIFWASSFNRMSDTLESVGALKQKIVAAKIHIARKQRQFLSWKMSHKVQI